MSVLEIIASVVGIVGGAVGFSSTLIPLYKSKLKLKVVFPQNVAYCFYDYIEGKHPGALDYSKYVFAVDIGIINKSINDVTVYSIKMKFRNVIYDLVRFDDHSSNHSRWNNDPFSYSLFEKTQPLPIMIEASSTALVNVQFMTSMFDPKVKKDESIEIIVYCQDKEFKNSIKLETATTLAYINSEGYQDPGFG